MCKIVHRGACMAIFKGMGKSIFQKKYDHAGIAWLTKGCGASGKCGKRVQKRHKKFSFARKDIIFRFIFVDLLIPI